jgi:hypothetical protein
MVITALKHALTNALVLVKILYTDKAREIILAVDTSLKG